MTGILLQLTVCLFGVMVAGFSRPKECDHRAPVHECDCCGMVVGWSDGR